LKHKNIKASVLCPSMEVSIHENSTLLQSKTKKLSLFPTAICVDFITYSVLRTLKIEYTKKNNSVPFL